MKARIIAPRAAAAALVAAALASAPALAEEVKTGWFDKAEVSLVATAGNTRTNTFGFRNTLKRVWEKSMFTIDLGGMQARNETVDRYAVGDETNYDINEIRDNQLVAQNYYLSGRWDQKISDRFFWYAGAGWDRNRFAGIENRYTIAGGVGNIWVDSDKVKFRTDYAVTGTNESPVVPNPGFPESFVGLRFSWAYLHKFGANTTYTDKLILDENLNETSDYRADWTNSLSVSMTSHLALKVSLQWLYRHMPALQAVDVYDTPPPPYGDGTKVGTVYQPLEKLDNIFNISLVANF